jgi:hypothetical protein
LSKGENAFGYVPRFHLHLNFISLLCAIQPLLLILRPGVVDLLVSKMHSFQYIVWTSKAYICNERARIFRCQNRETFKRCSIDVLYSRTMYIFKMKMFYCVISCEPEDLLWIWRFSVKLDSRQVPNIDMIKHERWGVIK